MYPLISGNQVIPVDYSTFLERVEQKEIKSVELQYAENQILYLAEDEQAEECIYSTNMVNDPDLIQKPDNSGANFGAGRSL